MPSSALHLPDLRPSPLQPWPLVSLSFRSIYGYPPFASDTSLFSYGDVSSPTFPRPMADPFGIDMGRLSLSDFAIGEFEFIQSRAFSVDLAHVESGFIGMRLGCAPYLGSGQATKAAMVVRAQTGGSQVQNDTDFGWKPGLPLMHDRVVMETLGCGKSEVALMVEHVDRDLFGLLNRLEALAPSSPIVGGVATLVAVSDFSPKPVVASSVSLELLLEVESAMEMVFDPGGAYVVPVPDYVWKPPVWLTGS